MNQIVVDEIAKQLNRVNELVEVKQIIESKQIRNFNADYLNEEFRKITSAREKDYPTYRSEYRVTATLIRLRNQIIYQINKSPTFDNVSNTLEEFVDLSKCLSMLLKNIGSLFETEKNILRFAEEFDNTRVHKLSKHVNDQR